MVGSSSGLSKSKPSAQLEPESPAGLIGAGKAELKTAVGWPCEVAALADGDEMQPGLGGRGLNGGDKIGLQIQRSFVGNPALEIGATSF